MYPTQAQEILSLVVHVKGGCLQLLVVVLLVICPSLVLSGGDAQQSNVHDLSYLTRREIKTEDMVTVSRGPRSLQRVAQVDDVWTSGSSH